MHPRLFSRLALAGMLATGAAAAVQAQRPAAPASTREPPIDIPFRKFVLKNGLTLIVHEDHKAPIVAVNVWYHVGSKNERPGRTGFAHLFEHLMFQGTEDYKGEFFTPFEQVGVTDQNGTTNNDRTNYFENVPTNALDIALWMESDRMGHLLGAIDQKKLDEQRGVVQNENRLMTDDCGNDAVARATLFRDRRERSSVDGGELDEESTIASGSNRSVHG